MNSPKITQNVSNMILKALKNNQNFQFIEVKIYPSTNHIAVMHSDDGQTRSYSEWELQRMTVETKPTMVDFPVEHHWKKKLITVHQFYDFVSSNLNQQAAYDPLGHSYIMSLTAPSSSSVPQPD